MWTAAIALYRWNRTARHVWLKAECTYVEWYVASAPYCMPCTVPLCRQRGAIIRRPCDLSIRPFTNVTVTNSGSFIGCQTCALVCGCNLWKYCTSTYLHIAAWLTKAVSLKCFSFPLENIQPLEPLCSLRLSYLLLWYSIKITLNQLQAYIKSVCVSLIVFLGDLTQNKSPKVTL